MLADLNFLEAWSAVWKIFATAGFVILIGRLAWSAGPLLTSILIALPVNIGPGLLLVSLTQDSRFVLESALYGLAGGAGVAAFIIGFVRTQFFKNFYLSLLIGALGWGVITWCIFKSELTIERASSLVVLSAVSSYILLPKIKQNLERVATPASWNFLIKRGGSWLHDNVYCSGCAIYRPCSSRNFIKFSYNFVYYGMDVAESLWASICNGNVFRCQSSTDPVFYILFWCNILGSCYFGASSNHIEFYIGCCVRCT